MQGNRKLLFFTILVLAALAKLDGADLANVLVAAATFFGVANGAEHIGKGLQK